MNVDLDLPNTTHFRVSGSNILVPAELVQEIFRLVDTKTGAMRPHRAWNFMEFLSWTAIFKAEIPYMNLTYANSFVHTQ